MLGSKRTSTVFGVLGRMVLASDDAEIYCGEALRITTPPERWAYAARVARDGYWHGLPTGGSIYLHLHVVQGEVGIGVLTADNSAFVVERTFPASRSPLVAHLTVPLPQVGDLIIRNTAAGRSRILLHQVSVVPRHTGYLHSAECE